MLGHKELRERKGIAVKELKCGWPSVFETFQKIKDVNCEGFVKSTYNARFQTQEIMKTILHYILYLDYTSKPNGVSSHTGAPTWQREETV